MSTYCPDCYAPVGVPATAREGRCDDCRPVRARRHSEPRHNASSNFSKFLNDHKESKR